MLSVKISSIPDTTDIENEACDRWDMGELATAVAVAVIGTLLVLSVSSTIVGNELKRIYETVSSVLDDRKIGITATVKIEVTEIRDSD